MKYIYFIIKYNNEMSFCFYRKQYALYRLGGYILADIYHFHAYKFQILLLENNKDTKWVT